MPTPETEFFKKYKPSVPASFDGVNYDDNLALREAQDAVIREQWVQCMMLRLVRDELGKCYRQEGVNHRENCGKLRERYMQLLGGGKIQGYRFEQKHSISKDPGQMQRIEDALKKYQENHSRGS